MRMHVDAGVFRRVWLTGVRRVIQAAMCHGAIADDLGHQQRLDAPSGLVTQ